MGYAPIRAVFGATKKNGTTRNPIGITRIWLLAVLRPRWMGAWGGSGFPLSFGATHNCDRPACSAISADFPRQMTLAASAGELCDADFYIDCQEAR
jgi:hypothetical protein